MDVLLIPGFWLDASSWDDVVPRLTDAGLTPHPLTMPGVGLSSAQSGPIGLADWVDAVVAEIDALDGPVALVGHSGGGNVAWAAVDARPDRISRLVLVDTAVPPDGAHVGEFDVQDGVVAFPGWESFDDDMVWDLDPETRARTARATGSIPERIPSDPISLRDPRRHGVPVTLLMGGLDDAGFRAVVAGWGRYADEFAAIDDTEVVRLDSGHWPQFSQPRRLAEKIVAALVRDAAAGSV